MFLLLPYSLDIVLKVTLRCLIKQNFVMHELRWQVMGFVKQMN